MIWLCKTASQLVSNHLTYSISHNLIETYRNIHTPIRIKIPCVSHDVLSTDTDLAETVYGGPRATTYTSSASNSASICALYSVFMSNTRPPDAKVEICAGAISSFFAESDQLIAVHNRHHTRLNRTGILNRGVISHICIEDVEEDDENENKTENEKDSSPLMTMEI